MTAFVTDALWTKQHDLLVTAARVDHGKSSSSLKGTTPQYSLIHDYVLDKLRQDGIQSLQYAVQPESSERFHHDFTGLSPHLGCIFMTETR